MASATVTPSQVLRDPPRVQSVYRTDWMMCSLPLKSEKMGLGNGIVACFENMKASVLLGFASSFDSGPEAGSCNMRG